MCGHTAGESRRPRIKSPLDRRWDCKRSRSERLPGGSKAKYMGLTPVCRPILTARSTLLGWELTVLLGRVRHSQQEKCWALCHYAKRASERQNLVPRNRTREFTNLHGLAASRTAGCTGASATRLAWTPAHFPFHAKSPQTGLAIGYRLTTRSGRRSHGSRLDCKWTAPKAYFQTGSKLCGLGCQRQQV